MTILISNCGCKYEGQDKLQGKQEIVMNNTSTKVSDGNVEVRYIGYGKEKVIKL